jgi:hypothetical protein
MLYPAELRSRAEGLMPAQAGRRQPGFVPVFGALGRKMCLRGT